MNQNLLTDVPGISVGHADCARLESGVTAIVFDAPSVASVCVMGGAPGGRDLGPLDPAMTVQRIDAVALSGGSAFGADAGGGLQAALRMLDRGARFGGVPVPLVAGAVLFDLQADTMAEWGTYPPYRDLGYAAARAARADGFALGSVGAGRGATTASVKGGVGSASARTTAGHIVAALMVVNAIGTPLVGDGPHLWAAPFERDAEFGGLGWPADMGEALSALRIKTGRAPATTIGLVATDATLSKAQAHRLAIMAHDGLARAILPAHAPMDGDTIFAVSTARRDLIETIPELTELGHEAARTTSRAIGRAIISACSTPAGQKAWRDLFPA